MNKLAFNVLTIFWLIFVFGCGKIKEQATQIELNGINGPSYYAFDQSNKKIINVQKIEYLGNICCNVSINKDSIKLGEMLIVNLRVRQQNYSVFISEPKPDTIVGTFEPNKFPQEADAYYFTPQKTGLYSFKCYIEYDTVSVPFEYKFIVLPK